MNKHFPLFAIMSAVILAAATPCAVVGAEATALSPLRVSDNGRMLVAAAGDPVFILADTAWSLAYQVSREDAGMYAEKRRSQRFNALTFVLCAPGRTELTTKPTNVYGDAPFQSTAGKFDPSKPVVTPGNDFADADAYDFWDHVDYLVALTRRLGLYAIILPTWGSGVTGSYTGTRPEEVIFDADKAYTYGRWVASRYRDQPHIVWMLGGDRSAIYGRDDYRAVFRALASGVTEGAPGKLISYHPRKAALQSSAWFHHDDWLAFNSVQEWPEDQVPNITQDWALQPAKPTWLFEGRYEGYWRQNKAEDWGAWQMRQQAYQTVVSGAFGHTYGHERVFGFGTDNADWKQYLDTPGARNWK